MLGREGVEDKLTSVPTPKALPIRHAFYITATSQAIFKSPPVTDWISSIFYCLYGTFGWQSGM